ncbi:MAG TPA: hemerythrin family protein [Anaeromyxobacter sp.]
MAVDWTPELTINDELLDLQHVELFRRLEEAEDALKGPREALDAAVSVFADSLMTHIALEERVMDDLLYPERVRHKSAHELFVADFEQMRAELRAKGPTPAVGNWVRRRIPEWLKFHIRVNDQPFAAWLQRRRDVAEKPQRVRKPEGGKRSS